MGAPSRCLIRASSNLKVKIVISRFYRASREPRRKECGCCAVPPRLLFWAGHESVSPDFSTQVPNLQGRRPIRINALLFLQFRHNFLTQP
jgi:hypothetical protein